MSARVIVVPRWAGTPNHDWYPWLAAHRPHCEILALPEPATPTIAAWPPAIAAALLADRDALGETIAVGHSVGVQALLRALALLPEGARLKAVLAVAGWWSVDAPWPSLVPWLEVPAPLDRIRTAAGAVAVLLSTNDPFTADHAANAELWRTRMGAAVTVVPGAKHFNAAQEPAVLAALERLG